MRMFTGKGSVHLKRKKLPLALAFSFALNLSIPSLASSDDCASGGTSQRSAYCAAAKSAQKATVSSGIVGKVWSSVAVVCTASCASSFGTGGASAVTCSRANLVGGVSVGVATKKFAGDLVGIASNAFPTKTETPPAESGKTEKSTNDSDKKKNGDHTPCLVAAQSAQQAMASEKTSNDAANNANSDNAEIGNLAGNGPDLSLPNNSLSQSAPATAGNDSCAHAKATGDPNSYLSCAVQTDPRIPGFVRDPQFQADFRKVTGGNLGSFLNSNAPSSASIPSALGGVLGNTQAQALAGSLNELKSGLGMESAATYARSGSGSTGAPEEDPMGKVLEGLVERLLPKNAEDQAKSGVASVALANRGRSPASITNDKSLSIFDRVSYRYLVESQKILNSSGGAFP